MSGSGDNIPTEMEEIVKKKLPIIWVLGGPGSGKGTQCEKLVARYGFVHLSSGDLLRDEVASESKLGQEIKDIMVRGDLVPREIVLNLIKNAMVAKLSTAKGFLIDGYPREIEQGVEFEKRIAPCTLVLYFDCSDEEMTRRLLGRALKSGRADDNEETIKKRLVTFHQHSEPVIQKYSEKVAKVTSNTDPDTIFAVCVEHVDGVMKKAGLPVPT
jgi:adenylate kinase